MSTAVETDHLTEYWDGQRVPQEAREALNWCVERELLAPIAAREIHAGYWVTRGQLAQILTALEAKEDAAALLIHARQCAGMASRSQANHEAIQSTIEDVAKRYGAVGIQVAVLEHGEVTDAFTYGRADKNVIPAEITQAGERVEVDMGAMTRDHKIRVASISKVVIAMNTMAMVEDGLLDLDSSIGDYWNCRAVNRAYPNTPVSIRSVLSHTSSIPIYDDSVSRRYTSVRQRLAGGKFTSLKPGDIRSWGYNNYAFGVLGMTLELVENRRYDDIADDNFFLPLDIDAGVVPGELDHPELIATIYRHSGAVGWSAASQRKSRYRYDPGDYGYYFCGGLTISAIDLAKLYGVLAGDGAYEGQRLLSPASVEAMETPLGKPYGQLFEQCHPLRRQVGLYGRSCIYQHGGSAYGVYNVASYDPETGDGVIVLTIGASSVKDSDGIYAVCGAINQCIYETIADGAPAAQN